MSPVTPFRLSVRNRGGLTAVVCAWLCIPIDTKFQSDHALDLRVHSGERIVGFTPKVW